MKAQSSTFKLGRLPQRAVSSSAVRISPPLKLIALVIFLPEELSFYISDFRLSLIRLVVFLLTPVLLIYFSQLWASKKLHLVFSDILIALTGIWMIVSPALVVDLGYSLHHSAPAALEFCGSYLAARTLLSERGQALRFVDLICHVIAVVALIGVLDTVTSRPIVHDFLSELTGYAVPQQIEYRLNIFRATGPIEHPILFGIVCVLGLLLAISSAIRAKGFTIAACAMGVLLSLSSAPIQAAIFALGLLAYDRIFARYRGRWWLVIGIGALGIAASYAFNVAPLQFVIGKLSLDPGSYWIRMYQWTTVGSVVSSSPWIGIAFEWHAISQRLPFFVLESVDSLWLNLALVYGIPGAILVCLSMIGAVPYPTSGPRGNLTMEESKLARTLGILMFVIVLLGFTVDFWGSCWIFVGILAGVRAHLADLGSQRFSTLPKTNSMVAPQSCSPSPPCTRARSWSPQRPAIG